MRILLLVALPSIDLSTYCMYIVALHFDLVNGYSQMVLSGKKDRNFKKDMK